MTTETHNPDLQALFADATHELDGEAFTGNVMAKTRRVVYQVIIALVALVLVVILAAWWFSLPVQQIGLLITQFLATPLIDLGDGWASWLAAPVNNVAALFVVIGRLLRITWKKMIGASYG